MVEAQHFVNADFTAEPLNGEAPLAVYFTNATTVCHPGCLQGYEWNFGDGGTSNETHPIHTYAQPGTYTVILKATLVNSVSSTFARVDYITVTGAPCPAPVASFNAVPDSGCVPLQVQFTDQSVQNGAGCRITDWLWSFGDGNSSTQQNPVHSYSAIGRYTVSLTVTNNEDNSHTVTHEEYIKVVACCPKPRADFRLEYLIDTLTVALGGICCEDTIRFYDQSIQDKGSGCQGRDTCFLTRWVWDLGDGTIKEGQQIQHCYGECIHNDEKTITLTVTNCAGDTAMISRTITLVRCCGPPQAYFECPGDTFQIGQNITLTDQSTISSVPGIDCRIVERTWNFGDGRVHTTASKSVTFVYEQAGSRTVSLQVKSNSGELSSWYIVEGCIEVLPCAPPTADFKIEDCRDSLEEWDSLYAMSPKITYYVCTGQDVKFLDASIQPGSPTCRITQWEWNFGDGGTSNIQNPTHRYSTANDAYQVQLKITNSDGYIDYKTKYVRVIAENATITSFYSPPSVIRWGCDTIRISIHYNGMDHGKVKLGGGFHTESKQRGWRFVHPETTLFFMNNETRNVKMLFFTDSVSQLQDLPQTGRCSVWIETSICKSRDSRPAEIPIPCPQKAYIVEGDLFQNLTDPYYSSMYQVMFHILAHRLLAAGYHPVIVTRDATIPMLISAMSDPEAAALAIFAHGYGDQAALSMMPKSTPFTGVQLENFISQHFCQTGGMFYVSHPNLWEVFLYTCYGERLAWRMLKGEATYHYHTGLYYFSQLLRDIINSRIIGPPCGRSFAGRMTSLAVSPSGRPSRTNREFYYSPSVAFDGEAFRVAWCGSGLDDSTTIYVNRVDCDGTFDVDSARAVCRVPGMVLNLNLRPGSGNLLLSWTDTRGLPDNPGDVYGTLLNADGTVSDPHGFVICSNLQFQYLGDCVFNGDQYVVVWTELMPESGYRSEIYYNCIKPNGEVLFPGGRAICHHTSARFSPSVAATPDQVLVVWSDDRHSGDTTRICTIYGGRISRANQLLDPDGFMISSVLSTQLNPAVAFDGHHYRVVWSDDRNIALDEKDFKPGFDILGAVVSPIGQLIGNPDLSICKATEDQYQPRITAADSASCMIGWFDNRNTKLVEDYIVTNSDLYGSWRFDAVSEIELSTGTGEQITPDIAYGNGNYLVSWTDLGMYDSSGSQIYFTLADQSGQVRYPKGMNLINPVGVSEPAVTDDLSPTGFEFHCYPNPFEENLTIEYQVTAAGPIRIEIFDMLGRPIRLIEDRNRAPGRYCVKWDGKNESGFRVCSGIYLCRLQSADGVMIRTILRLK